MATRVHNTVTLNGADQMTRAGRFLVVDWANAYSQSVLDADETILSCVEAHCRWDLEFKHERKVSSYRDGHWQVHDKMTTYKDRARTFRLHWLLLDGEWTLRTEKNSATLRLQTPHGFLLLKIHAAGEMRASLVRAGVLAYGERDTHPYEGWVSRTYGEKSPALSFAVDVSAPGDVDMVSEFSFEDI